ncbi:DUF411 domain-containing protein [Pseudovibrio exalbescens]|uniref:DUF411 domain-containing protein n=1 Tax=Pseudovibrio exalbescens TaxID=197461 RepID=UPI000C9A43D0|nr:DUF411 domain-containing protein [Pseudovibrio exalbescens]
MKNVFNGALIAGAVLISVVAPSSAENLGEVHIYKSEYCGCCTDWADALAEKGYSISVTNTEELTPIKKQAGVSQDLMSCHTATLAGYVLEGHVPLAAIDKLLEEKPQITGLSVPGMPVGSLGMGEPDATTRYTVYAYGGDLDKPIPFFEVGN